jgi:hypothetical protein
MTQLCDGVIESILEYKTKTIARSDVRGRGRRKIRAAYRKQTS